MRQRLATVSLIAWRTIIVLLTMEIAAVTAMRYFAGSQTPPELILSNAFAHPFLILHIVGGLTALVVGPLQFVKRIRERVPAFHRATGRIYAAACAIGAPAGFMLAIGTVAGPIAAVGFAIPAVLWPVFTFAGVRAAIDRRLDDHREWMLRSYAICANAITLRLMLPAPGVLGFEVRPAYRLIAWLGWIVNLALVELYLRRGRHSAPAEARLATA